ncbi:MAG: hypothetical protein V4719_02475 [Planctomycetota bacterium]
MSVANVVAVAGNLFEQLFARRKRETLDARGRYIALRNRMVDGGKVSVEEVDITLRDIDFEPERLKVDLENEARRRELVEKRKVLESARAKLPELIEAERLAKVAFDQAIVDRRNKLAELAQERAAADTLSQIHSVDQKLRELESKLNDFGDPPVIEPGRPEQDPHAPSEIYQELLQKRKERLAARSNTPNVTQDGPFAITLR